MDVSNLQGATKEKSMTETSSSIVNNNVSTPSGQAKAASDIMDLFDINPI